MLLFKIDFPDVKSLSDTAQNIPVKSIFYIQLLRIDTSGNVI